MSEKKFDIHVPPDYDGKPISVVILEGEALDPINRSKVAIAGVIGSAVTFLAARKGVVNKDTSHVEVNIQKGTVVLFVDADQPNILQEIKGQLVKTDDLTTLDVNSGKMLSLKETFDLLRKNKFLFADQSKHEDLVKNLQDWKGKAELTIEEMKDITNGSKRSLLEKKVTNEKLSFKAKMPIYVGREPVEFHVDIYCDLSDAGVRFWLESTELMLLERTEKQAALDEVVKALDELNCGLPIITK